MKPAEIAVLIISVAIFAGGVMLAVAAVRDPAWGRSGDVAAPYAAMFFQMGMGAAVAGLIGFAVVWMRKR